MVKLKPCPYCGGRARILKSARSPDMFYAVCGHCGELAKGRTGEKSLDKAWNRNLYRRAKIQNFLEKLHLCKKRSSHLPDKDGYSRNQIQFLKLLYDEDSLIQVEEATFTS